MDKIRTKPFPPYNPIGEEEQLAVEAVLKSGILSDFIGRNGEKFLGGKYVRGFERKWADYHNVKHAISFNSATSALIAAVGASGIMPGDEVVVIAYSMCISATAPLYYDAIPVFADIEPDYYCMDPKSLESKISSRTKAVLTVDLFGQSTDMELVNEIARKHDLKVICDSSHAPGCEYNGGFAGTFGNIGIYSLNQHKIIHCGEGGIAVTNDDDLALRLQLIRNHGEAVVGGFKYDNLSNMLGGNFRLPEIEAAIAIEQLKKLPVLIRQRIELAEYLTENLYKMPFLSTPKVRNNSKHVYYLYPIKYHEEETGISRENYIKNINDLGIPLYLFAAGYIKPLYLEPIFSAREKFKRGYPYSLLPVNERPIYQRGLCQVTERLYDKELFVTSYNYPPLAKQDMDDIIAAFEKAAMMR
jgi:dTDP-4-amino-4,6-dideoxygalactose transaminase